MPTRRKRKKRVSLSARFARVKPEFRPDREGSGLKKLFHITRQQWDTFFRWLLYAAMCLLLLLIQDIIMSRIVIFGATTDLVPAAILLICVMENCEVGSLFALIASVLYFYSGSSPFAYSVIIITALGMGASMLRQQYLHRSAGTIVTAAGLAQILYEILVWALGIFLGLTRADKFMVFFMTGVYSTLVMIPLYAIFRKIGTIGGRPWKE